MFALSPLRKCHSIENPECVGTATGSMDSEIARQDLGGETLWAGVVPSLSVMKFVSFCAFLARAEILRTIDWDFELLCSSLKFNVKVQYSDTYTTGNYPGLEAGFCQSQCSAHS